MADSKEVLLAFKFLLICFILLGSMGGNVLALLSAICKKKDKNSEYPEYLEKGNQARN
jgi:hypothetical protein